MGEIAIYREIYAMDVTVGGDYGADKDSDVCHIQPTEVFAEFSKERQSMADEETERKSGHACLFDCQ